MQNAFIEDWPQGVLCFKLLIEYDGSFLIALFLAFFEKKKKEKNQGNKLALREKNWRLTSVVTEQKMNFVIVEINK